MEFQKNRKNNYFKAEIYRKKARIIEKDWIMNNYVIIYHLLQIPITFSI